ncbi:MAG: hypothetical protein P8Y78_03400 [Acidihalobacter sp.]
MKKSHPDEDKIPTLRDLVFPGNQELRRPPEHERERIEPRLEDDDDRRIDAPQPDLEPGQPADPFILLPEDELDWKADHPPERVEMQSDEEVPPLPDPIDSEKVEEEALQGIPAALPDEEVHDAESESDTSGADTDSGIEVEEEVSIEDLMTYFHRPRTPAAADLAPPPAPLTDTGADTPASTEAVPEQAVPEQAAPEQAASELAASELAASELAASELAVADTPPSQEDIRAAVRSVLEQELDRLTDIVTDAVVARLRH